MSFGLTDKGFEVETTEEIRERVLKRISSNIGVTFSNANYSVLATTVTALCDHIAQAQESIQALYASLDPDSATSVALANLSALTGTSPLPPVPSSVNVHLTGTPGVVVTAGRQIENAGSVAIFETKDTATLIAATAYSFKTYVKNEITTAGSKIYLCTVAGTTTSSTPSGTNSAIIVDGATFKYVGNGTAYAIVKAESNAAGPIEALADTLIYIKTPVTNWLGVRNVLDADMGRLEESDESLRLRRQAGLSGAGSHSLDALRADVLEYLATTASIFIQANVYHNPTNTTDVNGLPPRTFEILVRGGDDQELADLILAKQGPAYESFGNTTMTSIDSQGFSHTIKFSRPVEKAVYVTYNVKVDSRYQTTDIETQVKSALVAWGDTLETGRDATSSAISAQAFKVPGMLEVTSTLIGLTASPVSSATLTMLARELPVFDSSRTTVNVTYITP